MNNTYRDGKVHVLAEKCDTCIFRPGNKMNLQPGRVEGMVAETIAAQGVITCHKTLYTPENAVCRGGVQDPHDSRNPGQFRGRGSTTKGYANDCTT